MDIYLDLYMDQETELTTKLSIYDRVGFGGLFNIVWNSTPAKLRFSLPYGVNYSEFRFALNSERPEILTGIA